MAENLVRLQKTEENIPSGRSTPVFAWSPLPQRRCLNFKDEYLKCSLDKDELYNPNCDVNVWLRSCEQEIVEPISGEIRGSLGIVPRWLNGCLLRNGPGSLKCGQDTYAHLFDSSALLHRFAIKNGEVTYQCRFIKTEIFKKNAAAKRIVATEFGTKAVLDPCHTIFQKISSIFDLKNTLPDNSLISIYPFGDELYAFNEGPTIHRINPEDLETEGVVDVSRYVAIVNHTSHPHIMDDGTVYNVGMSLKPTGPHHSIVKFPPDGDSCSMFEKAEIVASFPARWPLHPSYMHTFGLTENYFIIIEQPLNISAPGIIQSKFNNEPLVGCFRWYHEEKTQIDLVNRKSGLVTHRFQTEPFFFLHIINQYETDDYVVLDICIYRDPAMLECMYIDVMKTMHKNADYAKMFRGRPARFVMPLKTKLMPPNVNLVKLSGTKAKAYRQPDGTVFLKPERLCNLGCETPRIHYERYLGKKYRYFYAISSDVDADNPGTIIKVDTHNRTAKTWCETNVYPSEPIFVPAPDPKSEDDGVVLSAMVWGNEDTNHAGLLILDAEHFMEIARVEFRTPGPVPKCLHGWYLPETR